MGEKLCRLKHEVAQFQKDMENVTSAQSTNERTSNLDVDINGIKNQVSSILNDERVAPYLHKDVPLINAAIVKDNSEVCGALIDQLKDMGGGGGKGVAYQLYASQNVSSDKMRLVKLDRQIGALEKKVGSIGDDDSMGFSEINAALTGLYAKLELLDGHKLESIQRRISSLATEFELLEGNMPKLRSTTSSEKQFNELYSHMTQWDQCTRELPKFISRLESQVNVHRYHSDVLIRLQKLRRQQLALNTLLMNDKMALKNASKSITTNLEIMNKNLASFKTRIAALKK